MARHLHFQTSFSVKPTGERSGHELFAKLQTVIFNWVCQKQNKHGVKQIDFAAFKTNLAKMTFVNGAKLETRSCFMDAGGAWGMSFQENDISDASRPWITDIGLSLTDENRVVNFSYTTSYVTTVAEEWETAVKPTYKFPRLIQLILEIPETHIYFSGGLPLMSSYSKVRTSKEALSFITAAKDSNREVSIVLLMGASRENEARARKLAEMLYGKVCVFLADKTPDVLNTFKHENHSFKADQIRIYYPRKNKGSRDYPSNTKWDELLATMEPLLRIPAIRTRESIWGISDVMRLRVIMKMAEIKEFLEEIKSKKIKQVDMEHVNLLQEVNNDLQKENEDLRDEIKELEKIAESEKDDLIKAFAKKEAMYLAQIRSQQETPPLPNGFPEKLTEVLDWAKLLPNLIITKSAYDAAKKYPQFKDFNIAWDMLLALNEHLFRLKFVENRNDLVTEFQNLSGYEFAKGEGPKTNSDSRLVKLRQFTHNGKSYEGWMHLKYGNQPNKLLRVHFDFDEEWRKIIVLHVGDHMPNATTSKL